MKSLNLQFVILSVSVIILLLSNCRTDDVTDNPNKILCETPRDTTYVLSDTVKEYISIYRSTTKVIFKTNNSSETVFDIGNIDEGRFLTLLTSEKCNLDTTFNRPLNISTQKISLSLTTEELEQPVILNLTELTKNFTTGPAEFIVITQKEFDIPDPGILFSFGVNKENDNINFYDSLKIGEKTFYSVLEPKDSSEIMDFKYTKNEGIIYIKDKKTGKEYVYDRVE